MSGKKSMKLVKVQGNDFCRSLGGIHRGWDVSESAFKDVTTGAGNSAKACSGVIPGHLLKDVRLPEFSWGPKLGVLPASVEVCRVFCFRCQSAVGRVVAGIAPECLVCGSIWGY